MSSERLLWTCDQEVQLLVHMDETFEINVILLFALYLLLRYKKRFCKGISCLLSSLSLLCEEAVCTLEGRLSEENAHLGKGIEN